MKTYDESLTMTIPLRSHTRFKVEVNKDGDTVLTIRRSFGFAVELVIEDSPLMVESFLEAFEQAAVKSKAIDRLRSATRIEPLKSNPTKEPRRKSGPTFPTQRGVTRPAKRGTK